MDYQGNSRKQKEEREQKEELSEKKIEKVVVGEVVERKKPIGRRFKNIFFGGTAKVAGAFVVADVILPALRDLLFDALREGGRKMIYGESTAYRRRPYENRSRIQYDNPMTQLGVGYRNDPRINIPRPGQSRIYRTTRREANDILVQSRAEAEDAVEKMTDIVEKYGTVTLADLREILGLPSTPIDNKWGWTYLNGLEIRQDRDGYLIDLPALEEV